MILTFHFKSVIKVIERTFCKPTKSTIQPLLHKFGPICTTCSQSLWHQPLQLNFDRPVASVVQLVDVVDAPVVDHVVEGDVHVSDGTLYQAQSGSVPCSHECHCTLSLDLPISRSPCYIAGHTLAVCTREAQLEILVKDRQGPHSSRHPTAVLVAPCLAVTSRLLAVTLRPQLKRSYGSFVSLLKEVVGSLA
jgi:hypothetical protein